MPNIMPSLAANRAASQSKFDVEFAFAPFFTLFSHVTRYNCMNAVRSLRSRPIRSIRKPQQARSRLTRQRILDAAVQAFEERGFEETTTAEIARRAGIGVGTLYGYFNDKRAILLELLQATGSEIADHVVGSLRLADWLEGDPRRCVRSLIDALFHIRRFNPGMQRILWQRYFKDPEFQAAVQAIERRVRGAALELFEGLGARGLLRIRDYATAAFVIYNAVEWTASRLILSGSSADIDAAVEACSDMISRYLFADG